MAIVNYILPDYILNVQFSNYFFASSTPGCIVTHVVCRLPYMNIIDMMKSEEHDAN